MQSGRSLSAVLGWGIALWLIGYVLGIGLFFLVPPTLLGWVIMPIGAALTWVVLWRRIEFRHFADYAVLAIAWTAIAVTGDFVFIVKALHPPDGYYKLDVYLYYALTFLMPLTVGWLKIRAPRLLAH